MAIFINILLVLNLIIGLLLILVTLMQRPKQEGLGAAFGGGMTENIFGAQTTNVLAKATRWLGGIFLGICLLISSLYAHQANTKSRIQEELMKAPQPVAPAASPEAAPATATATPETPAPQATTPEPTPEATTPAPTPEATATPAPAPAAQATPDTTPAATPESTPSTPEAAP